MTTYTLKLVSGVNYNLYNGATLVSDSDLTTLFGSAGSAFFVFDFDGGTPTNTTSLTIVDSNSQAVITNTGLSGIAENTNFNGDWSASATAFDTFVKSPAAVLDEAQMSDLMGKIKEAGIKDLLWSELPAKTLTNHYMPFSMKAGVYRVKNDTNASHDLNIAYNSNNDTRSWKAMDAGESNLVIIVDDSVSSSVYVFKGNTGGPTIYQRNILFGSREQNTPNYMLYNNLVADNLTSTQTSWALSANQGRILNNNIGTLSNLTTTAKTSAVAAINELHSNAALVGTTLSTPTNVAYVANVNIQDGAVTAAKLDITEADVSATLKVGNGNNTTVTLKKIPLGGNLYILTGIVQGNASSVTAGSNVEIVLDVGNANISACLGGVANAYQDSQAMSYTRYSRVTGGSGANAGDIDIHMYAAGADTLFYLNCIIICTIS